MRTLLSDLLAVFGQALRAMAANRSPRQLAAGCTLGMMLGLLPKDNGIAIGACFLLLLLPVNKGTGLFAAVVFSWFGVWADPFTHKLGSIVLGYGPLQSSFAAFYEVPLAPWLGFHNTVVMGSLLLGAYIAYPVYWMTRVASAWLSERRVLGAAGRSWRRWDTGLDSHPSRGTTL